LIEKIVIQPNTEHKGIMINDKWYTLIVCNHVDQDGAYYSVNTEKKVILTNMLDTDEVLRKVKDQYSKNIVSNYF